RAGRRRRRGALSLPGDRAATGDRAAPLVGSAAVRAGSPLRQRAAAGFPSLRAARDVQHPDAPALAPPAVPERARARPGQDAAGSRGGAVSVVSTDVVTVGVHPPVRARTRVVALTRHDHAYDRCFYPALENLGAQVIDGVFEGSWLWRELRPGDVLHLQWPSF